MCDKRFTIVVLVSLTLGGCASAPCAVPESLEKARPLEVRPYEPGCPTRNDRSWVAEDGDELSEHLDCFAAGGKEPAPVDFERHTVQHFRLDPGRVEVKWIVERDGTATIGFELWEACDEPTASSATLLLLIPRDVETVRLHECERHACDGRAGDIR